MRAFFWCFCGLLFCQSLSAALNPLAAAADMRRLETQLDQGQSALVLRTLPDEWNVSTPEGSYTISSEPLRDLLASQLPDHGDNLRQAKEWLDHIAAHLESSSQAPRAAQDAGGDLTRILARPEFAGLAPPSQWELLQERIRRWIVELLIRIFGFVEQHSTESQIFFWVLIGGTVAALAVWLFRRWTRGERISLDILDAPPQRTSDQWILAARAASEQGDFRRAIQCAYWAAIVRLEENGAFPRNRPHTPREYLRLVSAAPTGTSSRFAEPLAALTTRLERFWYAGFTASAEDFSACLAALEAIACRVD